MKVTKKFKNGNVNLENIDNPNNTLKLTMEELKDQFYTFTAESPAFEEKVIEVSPEEEGNLEESKATVAKLTKQEIDDALNEDSSEDDDLNFLKNRPCKN
jgi:hypothetical protein